MAPLTTPLEDPLAFPLSGVQVIEASAGTGKTWTLAALYVRLVLGHGRPDGAGLLPPQILVMTFTEAATGELRGRIRERLAEAAQAFRRPPGDALDDTFLGALRAAYPVADWSRCALQLDLAGQWMDEAAIYTIHGWSHRTLRQHAFESASLFRQEKLEDPSALWLAAARDYWRREVYPLDVAELRALEDVAGSPVELLEAIVPRRKALERDPQARPPAVPSKLREALEPLCEWREKCAAAEQAARLAWRSHLGGLESRLREAMARVLDARSFRTDWREGFLARMREWSASSGEAVLKDADCRRFSLRNLTERTRRGMLPPEDAFGAFALLDDLVSLREARPSVDGALDHAVCHVTRIYEDRKAAKASFDFPDLLQRLYHALHAPDGRLASAIRAQHPVALVDEFQDTDPWQYGALERIYLEPSDGSRGTLVMIGDPKQAIYGFRGADLGTYMRARDAAAGIHTLVGNFRSTAAVVEAVNHVFGAADRPFDPLRYEAVVARRKGLQPLQAAGGTDLPALTVWSAPGLLGGAGFRRTMAEAFASGIVRLLNDGVLSPPDVAILVADRHEAAAIRGALARRRVRSVYLSDRESVFATPEADDLWQILRAVSQPRLERHVRAAVATRSFGFAADELAALLADEVAMERQIERFVQWQFVWQRQGLLPMLYRLLHEQQIPARMLDGPEGERQLTNLLHLGDLLQRADVGMQGEGAVIRHFADRLLESAEDRGGEAGAEDAQMRLETDAGLVKVVTMHKSKGLQYPVVFLPFASSFRQPRRREQPDPQTAEAAEAARLAEDVRLLYVALTRAERAVFVGAATLKGEFRKGARSSRSALGRLLGRIADTDLAERLGSWAGCAAIAVQPLPEATGECCSERPSERAGTRPAEVPQRSHARPWGSHSFSSMTRYTVSTVTVPLTPSEADDRFADAQLDEARPAEPGSTLGAPAFAPAGAEWAAYPRGAKYGDLLHRLLEAEVLEQWPALRSGGPDASWLARIQGECDALGLPDAARDLLPRWLAAIAGCPLDDTGTCLAQLGTSRAWPEMSFLITSCGATARVVDTMLREHLLPGRARDALQPRALDGLLGGSLDLVYEAAGRWYVLDYKSNYLEAYDRPQLEDAILGHRYDLQYALYVLALHRLLRSRLPDYDYDRHVGGAVYFFVRGIGCEGSGIFRDRPSRALIEALDATFSGGTPGGAVP
jgi:exodeoxyribonuclease V beta subunit